MSRFSPDDIRQSIRPAGGEAICIRDELSRILRRLCLPEDITDLVSLIKICHYSYKIHSPISSTHFHILTGIGLLYLDLPDLDAK